MCMIMKKIIFIFIVAFTFNCFGKDLILVPNGVWYGNLSVRASAVICNFTIKNIIVEDNNVFIYGDHILGVKSFRFKFNLNEDKWATELFKINTLEFPYNFSFSEDKKFIKLKFFDICNAEGYFNLKIKHK